MNDEILLKIPAQQNMMLVARMTLAGYAARCGADVETIDDVRTACDEACYCLMHQRRKALDLSIRAMFDGSHVQICFETERSEALTGAPAHDIEIARGILAQLVCDAEISHDEDGAYAVCLRLCPAFPVGGGHDR